MKKKSFKKALQKIKEIESQKTIEPMEEMPEDGIGRVSWNLSVHNGKVYITIPLDKYRVIPR